MKTSDTIFEVSRRGQLEAWLRLILDDRDFTLTDLAADAGARRYFRIKPSGEDSLVVMDAPVAHNDNQQTWHHQVLLSLVVFLTNSKF